MVRDVSAKLRPHTFSHEGSMFRIALSTSLCCLPVSSAISSFCVHHCGHLVKVIWSKSISGTRSLLTIYKYKYLYYSGGFWQSVFDFDKWPNDQMTAPIVCRIKKSPLAFVDRNGNVVPLQSQKWATRRIADSKTPARWKREAVSLKTTQKQHQKQNI